MPSKKSDCQFSDIAYGTIDFDKLDATLRQLFPYAEATTEGLVAIGRSYLIGPIRHGRHARVCEKEKPPIMWKAL